MKFKIAVLLFVIVGCSPSHSLQPPKPLQPVEIVFLQLNDVYEIAPVEGGKYGGMARVAALRRALKERCSHSFAFLSGDFVSPSAIGTSVFDGKRLNGVQMIDTLNHVGLDYVTFGNHEFDLKEADLLARMRESKFGWISSNVRHRDRPFEKTREFVVLQAGGVRIGVIAVTTGCNPVPWAAVEDPIAAARRVFEAASCQADFVVALTHLSIEEDKELARRIPGLKLIMGGHEHTGMLVRIGETVIAKADANARTVLVHTLRYNPADQSLDLLTEPKIVDESLGEDKATAEVVDRWIRIAFDGFAKMGFRPKEPVITLSERLDGRENSIRYRQTNLGTALCKAMRMAAGSADFVLLNSGAVRLDDELTGPVTEYDIIRTLPFGGKIFIARMKGTLLKQILEAGEKNRGNGGFLQIDSSLEGGVDEALVYTVVLNEFLLSGNELNMGFLTRENPGIVSVGEPKSLSPNDFRLALIRFLKQQQGK